MSTKVKLYNKKGESVEVYQVDAKEILQNGQWSFDVPFDIETPLINEAKAQGKLLSPLRLVPDLTSEGENVLHEFGIQNLEELSQTPLYKLQVFGKFKDLSEADKLPIIRYIAAAESSAQNKSHIAPPGRKPGRPSNNPAS